MGTQGASTLSATFGILSWSATNAPAGHMALTTITAGWNACMQAWNANLN